MTPKPVRVECRLCFWRGTDEELVKTPDGRNIYSLASCPQCGLSDLKINREDQAEHIVARLVNVMVYVAGHTRDDWAMFYLMGRLQHLGLGDKVPVHVKAKINRALERHKTLTEDAPKFKPGDCIPGPLARLTSQS